MVEIYIKKAEDEEERRRRTDGRHSQLVRPEQILSSTLIVTHKF